MHESKVELQRELEQLTAQYDGPIHRSNDRVTVTCSACSSRRMVSAQVSDAVRVTCLRCGGRMLSNHRCPAIRATGRSAQTARCANRLMGARRNQSSQKSLKRVLDSSV